MSGWQKIKTVATFEFLSTVKRPGYLIATFGMPLFMAAYAGVIAIPAYFAEKSGRQPAVHGVVDQAGVLRLDGRSRGRRWFARSRGGAPRARSGRPVGGARSGRHVGELRVPAGGDRRGGPPRARRPPAEGLLRHSEGLHDGGAARRLLAGVRHDVRVGLAECAERSAAAAPDRTAYGRDHCGAGAEADRAHAALRGDTDRRDPRRRRRGVDPAAGRADHLHGAVPDLGADDVGLSDAGHGDREGEQGGRRAAGVGQSRSDPRRQAARARRRGPAADCGVARDPDGRRASAWCRC